VSIATLGTIFAAGFMVMTPVGPVSTICIRRALLYGSRAGIVAGAGDALAVAIYATIGITGGTFAIRFFAPFATTWHIVTAVVLVAVAILIWRSRPALPKTGAQSGSTLAGGFGAALGIALANPADIVLFAALFAGLGVSAHSPLEDAVFFLTFFAGGCAYWIALALFLDHWRSGLTTLRITWLNRACSAFMFAGAAASIASLARTTN
jgi:threonine/homoserine/homoserine lactone efflux protein